MRRFQESVLLLFLNSKSFLLDDQLPYLTISVCCIDVTVIIVTFSTILRTV